ncbi:MULTISPECIES: phosphoglycerate mutase family protein [Paraliobacillus]|uniref:phosphoglycerate mutase family protein n=1 Tax=Paraliobacillus TaxID=200903 RepID=UPI000DD3EC79|nr:MULTISPECIES: phosphoglycerate mutase family protein [Paraliobacillus]
MEISIIRHGKSQHTERHKLTCFEFKDWMRKYDSNGVFEKESYPSITLEKVNMANIVITSDLKRSIDSAALLTKTNENISYSLFRETELPACPPLLSKIKLNPTIWAILLRVLWFSGYSKECESLKDANVRAEKATQKLIEYATKHDSVVLIGHGFFNRLIAKELKDQGWEGKRRTGLTHWNCTTYSM